jgi:hypothetical protein
MSMLSLTSVELSKEHKLELSYYDQLHRKNRDENQTKDHI